MAIAAVANWDWPQEWPGLLENIVSSIKQRSDPNLGECSRIQQAGAIHSVGCVDTDQA